MLDVISRNFVAFSTTVAVVSSIVVISFVYSYLSVFDWSLIWLIEYSDLAKFALLAGAMISAWASFTINQIPYFDLTKTKSKIAWSMYPVTMLLVVALNFWGVRASYRQKRWDDFHYGLYLVGSEVALVLLVAIAPFFIKDLRNRSWQKALNSLAVLFFAISLFGKTYGMYIKTNAIHNVVITLKNSKIEHCKIIMLLSHHTAVVKGSTVVIVPASEILQISSE